MHFDSQEFISLICAIPAMVFGLTLHEFAHAYVGWKLGDDTPKRLGRVTLDPLAHLDLVGSIFFVVMWFSGFGLGWAKPVPIHQERLRHPRRDMMLVALAGPASNLLQVPFWLAGVFLFGFLSAHFNWDPSSQAGSISACIGRMLLYGVNINVILAAFNLLPLPPLDGHWVLQSLGGREVERYFELLRPYSFVILILLVSFTPFFDDTIGPLQKHTMDLAQNVFFAGIRLAG